MTLKNILTSESFKVFGFDISSFAFISIIIFVVLFVVLKLKQKDFNFSNGIKLGFITLSIMTLLFSFINFLTGEFLFSNKENFRLYMFIALIAMSIYVKQSCIELFRKNE